jgi:hypothetical protein
MHFCLMSRDEMPLLFIQLVSLRAEAKCQRCLPIAAIAATTRPRSGDEATRIMGEAFDAASKGLTTPDSTPWSAKSSRSALSKRQRRASAIRFVCAMPD